MSCCQAALLFKEFGEHMTMNFEVVASPERKYSVLLLEANAFVARDSGVTTFLHHEV